jgi:hypothetical protein
MFNLTNETKTLELHRRKLIHEAKLQHLIHEMKRDQVKMHERLIALVADLMISGGSRLKARYNNSRQSLASPTFYEIKPQSF